jgi:hypothetical protein
VVKSPLNHHEKSPFLVVESGDGEIGVDIWRHLLLDWMPLAWLLRLGKWKCRGFFPKVRLGQCNGQVIARR